MRTWYGVDKSVKYVLKAKIVREDSFVAYQHYYKVVVYSETDTGEKYWCIDRVECDTPEEVRSFLKKFETLPGFSKIVVSGDEVRWRIYVEAKIGRDELETWEVSCPDSMVEKFLQNEARICSNFNDFLSGKIKGFKVDRYEPHSKFVILCKPSNAGGIEK